MSANEPVIERMAEYIRRWEKTGDRRALFLNCYMHMTGNMLLGLDAGRFQDDDWVHALLHHFADYYWEALAAYERNDPATPRVWRHAHNAARLPETWGLQNLFLGINAHINYDLVLALTDMLDPEWARLSPAVRQVRYEDHRLVNTIIAETVDQVQDEVIEPSAPSLDLIDKALGPFDEWLISRLIARWRDDVWHGALRMVKTSSGKAREALRLQLETTALERANRFFN